MTDGAFVTGYNGEGTPLRQGEAVRVSNANRTVVRARADNLDGYIGVVLSGVVGPTGPVDVGLVGAMRTLLDVGLSLSPGDPLYVSAITAGRLTTVPTAGSPVAAVAFSVSAYAQDSSITSIVVAASAGTGANAVVTVPNIAALRSYTGVLAANLRYLTAGYISANDGGNASYRWDPLSTATDDGVLTIAVAGIPLGRFRYVNTDPSFMFNGLAAGPALADLGTRTVSFDPNFVVGMGTEVERVTGILRNSGFAGMTLSKPEGTLGKYKVLGFEKLSASTAAFVGFTFRGVNGAQLVGQFSDTPVSFSVLAEGEVPLLTSGYTSRHWLQVIPGSPDLKTFPDVTNVVGMSVGQTYACRFGADPTDASGWCASWSLATIASVTVVAGAEGNVTVNQSVPEQPPASAGINLQRIPAEHDMIRIVGFQDNTCIEGFHVKDMFFSSQFSRNIRIDCTYDRVTALGFSFFACENAFAPFLYVNLGTDVLATPGSLITLFSCYNTHVGSLEIDEVGAQHNGILGVLGEELSCRGTRLDAVGITYNSANALSSNTPIISQSGGATNFISIGHLTERGGWGTGTFVANLRIDVYENRCFVAYQNPFIRMDQVERVIFHGLSYTGKRGYDYVIPCPTSATSVDLDVPFHGLVRRLRIKPSTMTGITSVVITGDNFTFTAYDVIGSLSAGVWCDINQAAVASVSTPNFVGYNSLKIRVVSNGSTPADAFFAVESEEFIVDLVTGSGTDTSVPRSVCSAGPPAFNASFIGQRCLDKTSAPRAWFTAVQTGTGATDWA